jgi:4-amino-4-deoxy-L-arabinose transferase-like glycosyltransferase
MPATRRGIRLRLPALYRTSHRLIGRLARIPFTAWVCAAVACLNASCWSIISPPFEVPDEPAHFAYVETLAETGSLPTSDHEEFADAEEAALAGLHFDTVFARPADGTISTQAEQSQLEYDLARPFPRAGIGDAGVATSQPPLYYALEAIPYRLASSGTVLDRLAAMRLLSALMGGVTALFVFLFIREALPGASWAWTVGGLSVALAPLLGMISGAVNPDALCFAISAALFYAFSRGFRRGLTPKLAGAIGTIIVLGYLTKFNFLGLIPGAVLGLLALSVYAARQSRRTACRSFALATVIVVAPALLIALMRGGSLQFGIVAGAIGDLGGRGSLLAEIEYIWQFYLPRLPGTSADFHGVLTTRVLWFNGLVGLYGWLDTTFPNWVYNAALAPACLIGLLLASALFKYRRALRDRLVEAFVYLAMGLGVLTIVGASDYMSGVHGEFKEPRYLLPMLALWGASLALAARGAGRRWGPVAGVLIVLLFLAHDIFSQLLVISRFYG